MATVGIKLKELNFTLKSHHKLGFTNLASV